MYFIKCVDKIVRYNFLSHMSPHNGLIIAYEMFLSPLTTVALPQSYRLEMLRLLQKKWCCTKEHTIIVKITLNHCYK
jgi:hypothetical protein